jgi:predicted nucleic acid-binding protein
MHPWIIGELVLGGLSREQELLLERLPTLEVSRHHEVLELIRHRRLSQRGIGWVDANLVAAALENEAMLWTADKPLANVVHALRIQYVLP